jgi:UDP:flavonoid glycosyltransferase YjiC (YdhE family)
LKFPLNGGKTKELNINKNPTILIGILDWGLGHASRMVPIIRYLLQFQCQIFVAATGRQKKLLETEFPQLNFLTPPDYNVKYNGKSKGLTFGLFRQIPRLIRVIRHEKAWVGQVVNQYKIEAIISDNRYGFRSSTIPSIIISHQVAPKSGISSVIDNIVKYLHVKILQRFGACWIPDAEGSVLSGELSCQGDLPPGFHFIGPLSRFAGVQSQLTVKSKLLIILSGPEPNRTVWEDALLKQLANYDKPYTIVRGLPGETSNLPHCVNHLAAQALQKEILEAEAVICRAGYTSIMDLLALRTPALLVPTPGQTEQEYLAKHLSSKMMFMASTEQGFSLGDALHKLESFAPRQPELDFFRFRIYIDELISRVNNKQIER